MKFGARIIKTGIAIVLALYLAQLLNLPAPVFAGISAIFAIQPTIYRSFKTVMEQIQGNIIGAIVAVLFVLLFGNNIFLVGLAVVVVITINLKLKMDNTIVLTVVTVIAVMENQQGNFLEFASFRFLSILLGILSSFLVNLVFIPPKYEAKVYSQISSTTEDILKWIRISTRHASGHTLLKKDIGRFKDDLLKMEQLFSMFKEERKYKKENISTSRKLVVYRQLIITTKKAYETLRRIHKFENEINMMPDDFQLKIIQHIDCLIYKHEEMLLKHIRKIRTGSYAEDWMENCLTREELLDLFFKQHNEMDHELAELSTRLVPLIAYINEYDEQLEHLEKLINSFQSYHKDENHVSVNLDD
ncbi:FUSC family protein [Peribacillus loiseleuriae]|uniref:FUSC family protein n=1 Tax=Peribacillus loiseleuriae TaxID=1679170 RepID=UPI003D02D0D3